MNIGGKMKVLQELYKKLSMQQSIVFVEKRSEADSVSDQFMTVFPVFSILCVKIVTSLLVQFIYLAKCCGDNDLLCLY